MLRRSTATGSSGQIKSGGVHLAYMRMLVWAPTPSRTVAELPHDYLLLPRRVIVTRGAPVTAQ